MFSKKYLTAGVISLLLVGFFSSAQAGVMINKTRIIYQAKDKSASVTLSNITEDPYAMQVWVNGGSDRSDEKVPFIATPALSRLGPSEDQIIKVIALAPSALPQDRESVFYFNAQEIPARDKTHQENQLTIAVRSRIKLFYRPAGLPGSAEEAMSQLSWQRVDHDGKSWLRASNNTPWHVSFSTVSFTSAGRTLNVDDPSMLAPFSSHDFVLTGNGISRQGKVMFSTINDYGGIKQQPNVVLH